MYDLFYIIEVSPQWYNLLIKDSHYCLACGGNIESFKRTIYHYVRKYKTKDRVLRAIRGLSDKGFVPATTYDIRKGGYLSGKHIVFNDLIEEVVEQALRDNRQDTPYNRTKKKIKAVTPVGVVASPLPPLKEVRAVKKISPLKIKRTTI